MIDPQLLKTNIEAIEENIRKRDLDIDLDKLKLLDESRRTLKFESEKLRAEQKILGKEIASASEKEKAILLEKAEKISNKVKSLSEETQQKDEEFFDAWIKIPNIVSSSSPVGKTDEDNKEIKKVGEPNILVRFGLRLFPLAKSFLDGRDSCRPDCGDVSSRSTF